MAHPLTQHPPNLLSFGAGSNRSPLAFGFGQPMGDVSLQGQAFARTGFGSAVGSSAFGSPGVGSSSGAYGSTPTSALSPGLGVGFGSVPSPGMKKSFGTHRPVLSPVAIGHSNTATSSLKRSRRTSSSPSSSPSPLPSSPTSPKQSHAPLSPNGRMRPDDLSAVGSMHLGDPQSRRMVSGKVKRMRTDERLATTSNTTTASSSTLNGQGLDVGVLLAALPPSSHLPILLRLIQNHPTITPNVMSHIPQPDLADCLREIDRSAAKIAKASVSWESMDGQPGARRWHRIEGLVAAWCNTASTYIRFFTSPPNGHPPSDSRTTYALLQHLTQHVSSLLSLIPASESDPSLSKPPSSAQPLLDLANLILSNWTTWLASLSDEVNSRGGMYPHSTVASWAEGLDQLTKPGQTEVATGIDQSGGSSFGESFASWSRNEVSQAQAVLPDPAHPLVSGFRSALDPVRQRFDTEVGWLVGRGRPGPVF